MPALTVNLISGREVEANLAEFQGNGAELKELVGCALRITPHRLRLLTADNVEIKDTAMIEDGIQCPITATIGEGQEIAEFCQDQMPHFSSKPVDDALQLPPGSEELSDGLLLGIAMMLAIKKERSRIWKKYRRILKEQNVNEYNFDPEDEWDECGGYWMKEEVVQRMEPFWREAHDGLKRCAQAAASFVQLDKRLQQKLKLQFYCRWEEHEAKGQTKRHRVYGVRQAYAAVEFDKVFGYWLELEGQFDKVASTCILTAWRERITTVIEVERNSDAAHVLKLFRSYCDLLTAAHSGQEAAAWIKPHTKLAVDALLKGLSKEAFMLRADAGLRPHFVDETDLDACLHERADTVITESMERLHSTAATVDGLTEGLWTFLRDLADDRCDPLRFLGMRLLTQYHGTNEETLKLFQKFAEFDWPHVRDAAQQALEECRSSQPPETNGVPQEVPTDCPSPRSMYMRSMSKNPITLTIPRLGGRRMRRGPEPEVKHVLFIVRDDECDEDEYEEE